MSHRRPVFAAQSVAALLALAAPLPAAAGAQLSAAGPKVTIDGNRATDCAARTRRRWLMTVSLLG